MHYQSQINKFTHRLKMRKQDAMVRCMVRLKSTSSHTSWTWETKMEWSDAWSESNQQVHIQTVHEKPKWNGQMHGQSQINKFTYLLEMSRQDGMVRCMARVKSTSSHTFWKWESKMEWSDAWSESNQQVHIQTGHEQARWNGQMHGQSQINKFTYRLEMKKQNAMVRCMVRVKSTSSQTSWKWESKTESSDVCSESKPKWNGQMHGQSEINKFTYTLEMRKQERIVRCMVRVKSTSSHTSWTWETKMEWWEAWSEWNKQVHIHSRNEKARKNGQMHGQSQINKFTYFLAMSKQDRRVRCMVRVKSTSSRTS